MVASWEGVSGKLRRSGDRIERDASEKPGLREASEVGFEQIGQFDRCFDLHFFK